LRQAEYDDFAAKYAAAKSDLYNREILMEKALASVENALEFLAVTGVEDKL
jgi:hypothetical protein